MFEVKKAIIMAAGLGSRLKPITDETPKPLIKVNGEILIEGIIESLLAKDITDIYIVVGYKEDCFKYLAEKYQNIKLIENKYFAQRNNISSLYLVREHLENCIILDGDQIINNQDIILKKVDMAGYCCSQIKAFTKEWVLQKKGDYVTTCFPSGHDEGYQLYSISYWDQKQGSILKEKLAWEYGHNKNYNIYWDDVWRLHLADFKIGIHEIGTKDIIEIDTLDELVAVDKTYLNY